MLNCEICKKEIPREKNSVVCSEQCKNVRQKLFDIGTKYFPTHGCDNCWGDLHHGCSEQCKNEFGESIKFGQDLWSIIRLIYPSLSSRDKPDKE